MALVAGMEPIATTQVAGPAVLRIKVVHLVEAGEADEGSAVPLAGVGDDGDDGARWQPGADAHDARRRAAEATDQHLVLRRGGSRGGGGAAVSRAQRHRR